MCHSPPTTTTKKQEKCILVTFLEVSRKLIPDEEQLTQAMRGDGSHSEKEVPRVCEPRTDPTRLSQEGNLAPFCKFLKAECGLP